MSIDAVIEEKDKDFSIYEVPLSLRGQQARRADRRPASASRRTEPDLEDWRELLHRLRNPEHEISIAVVGKYAEHHDAYKSIYESLDHAGIAHRAQVRIGRIRSEDVEARRPRAAALRLRRHPRARRLRRARHRRQSRRDPLRPHEGHPVLRHLPGHAVRRDRVRPQRRATSPAPTRPSSTRTRRTR